MESIGRLRHSEANSFITYANDVIELMQSGGPVTYWEHGGGASGQRSSACVSHAHLHLTSGSLNIERNLVPVANYPSLDNWIASLDPAGPAYGAPYLLCGGTGKPVTIASDPGISQYFRREIAAEVGRPLEWDYAAVPNFEVVAATVGELMDLLQAL